MQPEAQKQVQEALAGVLASQDKAQGAITVLENKAAKLQQQLESTQLALSQEQQAKADSSKQVHVQDDGESPRAGGGHCQAGDSSSSAGSDGPRPTGKHARDTRAATGKVPKHNASDGTPACSAEVPSLDLGVEAAAAGDGTQRSDGTRSGEGPPAVRLGMVAEQPPVGDRPPQNGAVADVALPGAPLGGVSMGAASSAPDRDHANAEPPVAGRGRASGNGNGAHGTAVASLTGSTARSDGEGAFPGDAVHLDRAVGIADGGAAMQMPTAAVWKGKLLDTSQNGHVVTDSFPRASSAGSADKLNDVVEGSAAVLVKPPPTGESNGSVMHRMAHETHKAVSGGAAHSSAGHSESEDQAAIDEEHEGALSWLQKRAHKLPWQE